MHTMSKEEFVQRFTADRKAVASEHKEEHKEKVVPAYIWEQIVKCDRKRFKRRKK